MILAYDKTNQTPRMQHIDYGLGAFKPEAFREVSDCEPTDLATLCQVLLERGELAAFEVQERFYEIGSFEGLRETEEFLKNHPLDVIGGDR
jgi:NDP-sugar pyrophosphorylase family protein